MQNILKNTDMDGRSANPWLLLLFLTLYVIAGLLVFSVIGMMAALPFFDMDFMKMNNSLADPYGSDEAKMPMMLIQALTAGGAFLVAPYILIKANLKLAVGELFKVPGNALGAVIIVIALTFCFMVANSVVIEWNQNVDFPDFLSSFESWAQDKEWQLERMTEYLTAFSTSGQFMIGLVVIAIIPAVGEELLFRGLVQNLFNKATGNAHLAIWVTAFIFAAFHVQFYGLVPRMLLGVLFGYLYLWSGSLPLAMLAHFVNNAFSLTALYLSQNAIIDMSVEELEQSPPFYIILLFLAVGTYLLFLFRDKFKKVENV